MCYFYEENENLNTLLSEIKNILINFASVKNNQSNEKIYIHSYLFINARFVS